MTQKIGVAFNEVLADTIRKWAEEREVSFSEAVRRLCERGIHFYLHDRFRRPKQRRQFWPGPIWKRHR